MTTNIKIEKPTVTTSAGPMTIFVARPESRVRLPAIIVLQEAFGVNSHIRKVCERYAKAGFVAVAPELFHRAGTGLEFGYDDFDKIRAIFSAVSNDGLKEDIDKTYQWLQQDAGVDEKRIAAVGYCMGGFAAALAACELPLRAAVSYYGGGMVAARPGLAMKPLLAEFKHLQAATLFLFGDRDQSIPDAQIKALRDCLKAVDKPYEIVVYPGAEHGFNCDERPSYQPEAAAKAWERTLAWLHQYL